VLLVSIFKTCCIEVTQKHLDSPNNLITDFYELTNSNVSNYKLQSLSRIHSLFRKFSFAARWTEIGRMRPAYRHFAMHAVGKLILHKSCAVYRRLVFLSISLAHTDWELILWPFKGPFSVTGLFNKKSRRPGLRSLISFFVWTQWSNVMLRGSNLIPSVWNNGPYLVPLSGMKDGPGFHCPEEAIFSTEFISGICGDRSIISTSACRESHTRNLNRGVVLVEPDYSIEVKHSYRRYQYVLQKSAYSVGHPTDHLCGAALYPIRGRSSPNRE